MVEQVKIHVLPGGQLPRRQTPGSIGYDVAIRAIVSPTELDPHNPQLRRTIYNFHGWSSDPQVSPQVVCCGQEYVYRMNPGESVLVGVGFLTAMVFPMFYWVSPRSGLASKWGISVTNAPGTVDPDYRGEAGVLVYNRNQHSFDLRHGMRIAQIVFQKAEIPELVEASLGDLEATERGSGGFGSTGL